MSPRFCHEGAAEAVQAAGRFVIEHGDRARDTEERAADLRAKLLSWMKRCDEPCALLKE